MTQGCNEGGGVGGLVQMKVTPKLQLAVSRNISVTSTVHQKAAIAKDKEPRSSCGKHCNVVEEHHTILSAVNSVHFTLIFVHNALFQ